MASKTDVVKKQKHTRRKPKQKSFKVTIAPAIISEVRQLLGVEESDALNVLSVHMKSILKYSNLKQEKWYWSTVDIKALYTLLENKLLGVEESDNLLNQLKRFEEWIGEQNWEAKELVVIDRAFFLLDFLLMNHSLKNFEQRIRSIVETYTRSQFNVLLRVMDCAIAYANTDTVAIDKDPEFNKFMYQAASEAIATANGKVKKHLLKRLNFIRLKIQSILKEHSVAEEKVEVETKLSEEKEEIGTVITEIVEDDIKEAPPSSSSTTKNHKRRKHKKHHHHKHTEM